MAASPIKFGALCWNQYADWARCPPQASKTASPVDVNRTRKSAVLLPFTEPAWFGPSIEVIVPPQMVSRRGEAEYFSAPLTDKPLAW